MSTLSTSNTNINKRDEIHALISKDKPFNGDEQLWTTKLQRLHGPRTIHQSLSLDNYFHKKLTEEQKLAERISSQTLSRFIYYYQQTPDPEESGRQGVFSDVAQEPSARADEESVIGRQKLKKTYLEAYSNMRHKILVVPQLWLWRIDSKLRPRRLCF